MREILFDERRLIIIPGNREETILFAAQQWMEAANKAISDHDFFAVALSGGSTPKAIYQQLVKMKESSVDWSKVYLFWSDERSVPSNHPDSNYYMAMEEGRLKELPLLPSHIFRMVAEENIEENARAYEDLLIEKLGGHALDLVMLGMGEDGHTASLFPHTAALKIKKGLVAANEVPQKNTWRMTFTFDCLNAAQHICLYAIGESKAQTLVDVLFSPYDPEKNPSQKVGTDTYKAHFILDEEAASLLLKKMDL